MPYPNVSFNPPYFENVSNVGPYQQNTGHAVLGQTRMDKTLSNQTVGSAVGPPSFSPLGRGSFGRG